MASYSDIHIQIEVTNSTLALLTIFLLQILNHSQCYQ